MNWYDYLIPTNSTGAFVFGMIISIVYAFINYRESKNWKIALTTIIGGGFTTWLVVAILESLGYIN